MLPTMTEESRIVLNELYFIYLLIFCYFWKKGNIKLFLWSHEINVWKFESYLGG